MKFYEVQAALEKGKKVRSKSWGKLYDRLEVINGVVFRISTTGLKEIWLGGTDILKNDFIVIGEEEKTDNDKEVRLEELKKEELIKIAKGLDIDTGTNDKKDDIINKINKATEDIKKEVD